MPPQDPTPLAHDPFGRNWVGIVSYYVFHWRRPLLAMGIAITMLLGWSATRLEVQAGFSKMLPLQHPYMQTFLKYQKDFGGANKVLVAVRAREGDVFNAAALAKLKAVHEDLFFMHGVDRSSVLSLYSPNTIFMEVVEDGFRAGPVLPSNFRPDEQGFDELRANLLKSQWVGRIVAKDFSAALVSVTLLDRDPATGERLDLRQVGADLEKIRAKNEDGRFSIHVIGFAKSSSDIAAGAKGVMIFFGVAFAITALLLFWYSGSAKLTALALAVALTPVVWLLGLLPLLGLALDPMSILVPFLIFSIGVSHAVQMTSAWKLEALRGRDGLGAARIAFVKLFVPGTSALLANAIGFLVIAFVKIEMVQELVITATLGVTLMILTNKILLPILLSYMRMAPGEARGRGRETLGEPLWRRLAHAATPRAASVVIAVGVLLLAAGLWKARDEVIGDLGQGVPELRADSRYNRDVDTITRSFAIGVDVLQVIAQGGAPAACTSYEMLDAVDRFEFLMRQTDGVQSAVGLASFAKLAAVGYNEGDAKWFAIPDTREARNQSVMFSTRRGGDLVNADCSATSISVFTRDHQARTLSHIVDEVKRFKESFDSPALRFELASGNAGVMAATNEAVAAADHWVNWALFGAVTLLCLITFRSAAITACIVLPLGLVTVLCYALMAALGIGMKVNTLPVVALGVGVGVDYGIYLFEVIRHEMQRRNASLQDAFLEALRQRATASLFTAVTMTAGVATWLFSALRFQADMGVLLAFMFLVNAFGAILLAPALATFLLRARRDGGPVPEAAR
ncbi:MAG TPA: efflux RND transporter permease subunit [Usitatibacter sp.]|nr:efflux RND transporter permease subunit [Usitatibacter sp.]